ncbi:MAG TPA: ATP-dependent 6-phosphofructokinase [Polyangia bacterium]|jgi:phosphofructokinase-like protein|nr:ATP-dependent 6-phosphofructokinase [Polyangia bacterium]
MHILVNTGGGDAPGLNAVIRAVTLSALRRGWKVTGIKRGYHGLLEPSGTGLVDLTRDKVRGIAHLGGTILGTVNKGHPFEFLVTRDGKQMTIDISDQIMQRFREVKADALIAIGGDGAFRIASRFIAKGMPIVGVPKTIDNDLSHTQATFGFDTAVTVATEAIDRLHSTAESHERIMVVEVMGRYAGWIALHAGVAGNAHVILMPEIPFDIEKVVARIKARYGGGRRYCVVVVAEGAIPKDGALSTLGQELGREIRLGGLAEKVGAALEARTGFEMRSLVLGHLQRGGSPTHRDRLLALRFGAAAVRMVEQGKFGYIVAYQPPHMVPVSIDDAISVMKTVPLDSDTVQTARDLGICLGD